MINKNKLADQTKVQKLFVVLSLLFSLTSGCPNHDLMTTYGGYNFQHDTTEFVYAVDMATFDMVAAGSATVGSTEKRFIYFLKQA